MQTHFEFGNHFLPISETQIWHKGNGVFYVETSIIADPFEVLVKDQHVDDVLGYLRLILCGNESSIHDEWDKNWLYAVEENGEDKHDSEEAKASRKKKEEEEAEAARKKKEEEEAEAARKKKEEEAEAARKKKEQEERQLPFALGTKVCAQDGSSEAGKWYLGKIARRDLDPPRYTIEYTNYGPQERSPERVVLHLSEADLSKIDLQDRRILYQEGEKASNCLFVATVCQVIKRDNCVKCIFVKENDKCILLAKIMAVLP